MNCDHLITSESVISGLNISANGAISAQGDITSFHGKISGKCASVALIGADANHTYALASVDTVSVPSLAGAITADRTYTIDMTGATSGMSITFANFSPLHTITINGPFEGSSTATLLNTTGNNVILGVVLIGSVLYPFNRFSL